MYNPCMAKCVVLNGAELAGFIKERQFHELRSRPRTQKLVIVTDHSNEASEAYMRIKRRYGDDVGIETEVMALNNNPIELVNTLNNDTSVGGVIIQLPFKDESFAQQAIEALNPDKDLDGLKENSLFNEPTSTAILWLLAGYNVDLNGKNIVLIGNGRLVGKPMAKALDNLGLSFATVDENTENADEIVQTADVIISGVGKASIIKSNWIKPSAVVIDAGVASENGVLAGDIEESARERKDISITPLKGGVGPLTVCALFENFLRATAP